MTSISSPNRIFRSVDRKAYPLWLFVIIQVLLILAIFIFTFIAIVSIASHFIEIPWFKPKITPTGLMILSLFGSIIFILGEYGILRRLRKYGIFGTQLILGYEGIWKEPDILIKLRDPRVSIRKKCLLKILQEWPDLQQDKKFREDTYLKRIGFCLIDKSPEVRKLACEILRKIFGRTVEDMEDILRYCFYVNFYLIDKKLKKNYEAEGLEKLDLCKNG